MKSLKLFEEIIMYLSVLRYIFKSRSKKRLYDLNKQAEKFFRDLFNLIYNWELEDLNSDGIDYPAIDLGDKTNKVCIQVTAENTSGKIKSTIDGFIQHKLHESYSRLVTFILTDKKSYSSQFDTQDKFNFDKEKDIWDIDDVLSDIENLPYEKLLLVHDYLTKELPNIQNVFSDKGSLLSRLGKSVGTRPLNTTRYSRYFHKDLLPEDECQYLEDFENYFKVLSNLSMRTREYLYAIIIRSNPQSDFIEVLPRDLGNSLGISDTDSKQELDILDTHKIAFYDDSDTPPKIKLNQSFEEFIPTIKEYLRNLGDEKDLLRSVIVDCDFSIFDEGISSTNSSQLIL